MVKPWEIDLTVYDDEAALLAGLRQKDRLACTCLLKRFAPRLFRLATRLTGDADEAEDVLQEAFIQACAHVADFEGRSGLGTWLHRIVVNTALARVRRTSLTTVPLEIDDLDRHAAQESMIDRAAGPRDVVLGQEFTETLEQAVITLPESLRAAFVLRDIKGLSTKEAAAAVGITESALKVRLHRARGALRGMLAPVTDFRSAESASLPSEVELRLLDKLCPPSAPRSIPEG